MRRSTVCESGPGAAVSAVPLQEYAYDKHVLRLGPMALIAETLPSDGRVRHLQCESVSKPQPSVICAMLRQCVGCSGSREDRRMEGGKNGRLSEDCWSTLFQRRHPSSCVLPSLPLLHLVALSSCPASTSKINHGQH